MLAVVYSCYNNYELLELVLERFCNYDAAEILLIDDGSTHSQFEVGLRIVSKYQGKIRIIKNEGKGLQYAVKTAFSNLASEIEWIYFPQQDVYPKSKNFISELTHKLKELSSVKYKENTIGAVGFKVIDYDNINSKKYSLASFFLSDKRNLFQSSNFYQAFKYYMLNRLGAYLSGHYRYKRFRNSRRWFSDVHYKNFDKYAKNYTNDFAVELPIWVAVCISRSQWEKHITEDDNIIFHMWFNDIAMQFLSKNVPLFVTPSIEIINHQSLKMKFGMERSSADAGRKKKTLQVENYGEHLSHFRKKWDFDYEDVANTFPERRYRGTLVEKFFKHDSAYPLKL